MHNTQIYALTKGQASPTTPRGETRTLQFRAVELAHLNALAMARFQGRHVATIAKKLAGA
jgi:2-oxoglutarate ferredoxin oxidoreductase subunit beta